MARGIQVGDIVRDRINTYRKGGDSLPLQGTVTKVSGNSINIDWDNATNTVRRPDTLERCKADGSDPQE